jgi:hypothetical protein
LGTPDRALPAFGLEVDRVETEAVFVDDPVDAFIGTGACQPAGGVAPAAVAHGLHDVEHDLFEERGGVVGDFVEELGGELVVERFVGPFEDGLRGFGGRLRGRLGLAAWVVFGRAAVAKLPVGLVAIEERDIEVGRILGEHLSAGFGNGEHAAADAGEETGPFEMDLGPTEAIDEPRLRAAWQQFRPFGGGEAEVIRDRSAECGERPVLAVGDAPQEREEDFVELWDGHSARGSRRRVDEGRYDRSLTNALRAW